MNYTTLSFIFVFLPLSLVIFTYVPNILVKNSAQKNDNLELGLRNALLALISFVFVFLLDMNTGVILIPVMLITYMFKCFLENKKTSGSTKKGVLFIAIVVTLLPLLLCKYLVFFASIFNYEISWSNKIITPIGISFFTFRQIMCLIECYKNNIECNFVEYVSYILFFPQITSGPIESPENFFAWTRSSEFGKTDSEKIADGLVRLVVGMTKKLLIANTLADMVNACYAAHTEKNSTIALFAIIGYSLQIYYDFSGYTDMTVGLGNLFGFRSLENFDSPYKARTVGEFWKKWHISLTRFFTKYIYIPLGGNRKGIVLTCVNIIVVFLISGLWHGAEWKYIIWGGIYGLLLALERLLKIKPDKVPVFFGRICTFVIVSFLWVFFRADTMESGLVIIKELFAFEFKPLAESVIVSVEIPEFLLLNQMQSYRTIRGAWPYFILVVSLFASQFGINSRQICEKKVYMMKPVMIMLAILAVIATMSFSTNSNFIYWNF